MTRDWFVLYRPSAPSVRAQSVQVLATADALAARGHRVTVCVQSEGPLEAIREAHGLGAETLQLQVLSRRNTWASLEYRRQFARFVRRTRGRGIVLARAKRHAAWALRRFPGRVRLILEAHEVDSLREDRGPEAARVAYELERTVLAGAWGLVANAVGTLDDLRRTHRWLPPSCVVHNAARPGGPAVDPGQDIGWVGSVRPDKDPETVAQAARDLPEPLRVVLLGPDPADVTALVAQAAGRLRLEPARWPAAIPDRLRRFRTLVVPLSAGRFGERWSSPLKLFDALQSGVPTVAADTAAVRTIAGDAFVPYRPGDAASLGAALVRASRDEPLRHRLREAARRRARTWAHRAAELDRFVDRLVPEVDPHAWART